MAASGLPVLGISACLLGHRVRYDGTHKLDPLIKALAAELPVISLCPEGDAGLGVPREPISLVSTRAGLRLRRRIDAIDITGTLEDSLERQAERLQRCAGLILKSRSPSCGVTDTPLQDEAGTALAPGPGYLLRSLSPDIPAIDERALREPGALAVFLGAVFGPDGDPARLAQLLALV